MNLSFKLASQSARSQAALVSCLWQARSQREQGAAVWSVLCTFQGTGTTQNHRLLKDQRQREKLAPKPGHSLEVIDYKIKMVSVCEDTWKSSLSPYKIKYSSFKISQWPVDPEPPSAALHS